MVVALIALIAALAGTAYAGAKIGTRQLKRNAVTTSKIRNSAVTEVKLKDGAATTRKLADGAATTAKLAGAAVTTAKLDGPERSEGFVTNQGGQIPLTAATNTTVATLNLPAGGHYVVTAATALGSNGVAGLVSCELRDDGSLVANGFGSLPGLAVFAQTITLTGASDGGSLTLACNADSGAQAKSRVITAVRVGSLASQ